MPNALYAQSGGVTASINSSAAGVINAWRNSSSQDDILYAAESGIFGILLEELLDTAQFSSAEIAALSKTPGGAFGSCRYKLKNLTNTNAEAKRLIAIFAQYDIRYFFYNGGNDSADTCLKISQVASNLAYAISAIHIPKTIDNDLFGTDNSPGFGSAAKYLATSVREAGYDLAAMCATSTKVFIMEVMGRNVGWLAAATGLASEKIGQPPHIILFPEIPLNIPIFLTAVQNTVVDYGYCVIVVSEGIDFAQSHSTLIDAFGHQQLGGVAPILSAFIQQQLSYKCHWAVSDYLQRSARHLASAVDIEQAYAVGQQAVTLALNGHNAVMVGIQRLANEPYSWKLTATALQQIANQEKALPRHFISTNGMHISHNAREYLLPLIMGEDLPAFVNGLPHYQRLSYKKVTKQLMQWNATTSKN